MPLHYLAIRKLVGILGCGLPLVLPLGCFVLGTQPAVRQSISAYHGTVMRDVFVGIVFAIGVFLFAYKGHEKDGGVRLSDGQLGTAASFAAFGVALFPHGGPWTQYPHYIAATAMFGILAWFCVFRFTLSTRPRTWLKIQRDRFYRACGATIVVSMVAIGLYQMFLTTTSLAELRPVFWLEGVALLAFGVAWLVKGEGLAAVTHDESELTVVEQRVP